MLVLYFVSLDVLRTTRCITLYLMILCTQMFTLLYRTQGSESGLTWHCHVSGYRSCGTSCLPSWRWCQPSSPLQHALATLKATDAPGEHTQKSNKMKTASFTVLLPMCRLWLWNVKAVSVMSPKAKLSAVPPTFHFGSAWLRLTPN